MILESQQKYKEAAALLESKLGLLCRVESDRERMLIEYFLKSGDTTQVQARSKLLLEQKYLLCGFG